MEVPEKENQEVKRRFQLWIKPSTLEQADRFYRQDNCASKSEYIFVLLPCGIVLFCRKAKLLFCIFL